MATIYVSKTATNGYGVGNDTRIRVTAASKTTPVLTVTQAISIAQAGDTIVINDGTYSEANYCTIAVANLTINSENDYLAIIRAATGGTRVIYQLAAGTGLTLGKIVVDANNAQFYGVQQDNSNNVSDVTFDGTKIIDFTYNGFQTNKGKNITFKNGWSIIGTTSYGTEDNGILIQPTVAGTILLENGTINITGGSNATSYVAGIYINTLPSGTIITINDNEITVDGGINTGNVYGVYTTGGNTNNLDIHSNNITTATQKVAGCNLTNIYAQGFLTMIVYGNDITHETLLTSGSYFGIRIPNSANTCKKCWVYDNTIIGGNPNPATNGSGISIVIGDDASPTPTYHDSINGVWVHGNTCSNMNHQILLGWITRGVVQGNKCTNGIIGVIGKYTTDCLFSGNVLVGIGSGGSLRAKGATGDIFCNNTVIMTPISLASGMAIQADLASSGVKYYNNLVYMDGVVAICVSVQDTATAIFKTNNYYSNAGFAVNTFAYQGNNYANIGAWILAHESSALNVYPDFVDYPNGDYRVPASNADLYHKGVYAGANARDYRGRPFFVKPTIGAYEVSNGDICVARTVRAS